jgi:hypothetical protein
VASSSFDLPAPDPFPTGSIVPGPGFDGVGGSPIEPIMYPSNAPIAALPPTWIEVEKNARRHIPDPIELAPASVAGRARIGHGLVGVGVEQRMRS